MQLAEDGTAILCLLLTKKTLQNCDHDWNALLGRMVSFSEQLAGRLAGAKAISGRPLALSSIPYGMLMRDAEPGLWRLGDQAAVIPSFAGDGISIALHSGVLAAEVYSKGGSSKEFAERLHGKLRKSIALATLVSQIMVVTPAFAPLMKFWPRMLGVLAAQTRVPQVTLVG